MTLMSPKGGGTSNQSNMNMKYYEQLELMYKLKAHLANEIVYYTNLYNETATYKVPDDHAKALGFEDLKDIRTYYALKTSIAKTIALDIKTLESKILVTPEENPNPFGQ